jgi:hypothetical protein
MDFRILFLVPRSLMSDAEVLVFGGWGLVDRHSVERYEYSGEVAMKVDLDDTAQSKGVATDYRAVG